jgi:hypothetical protein
LQVIEDQAVLLQLSGDREAARSIASKAADLAKSRGAMAALRSLEELLGTLR